MQTSLRKLRLCLGGLAMFLMGHPTKNQCAVSPALEEEQRWPLPTSTRQLGGLAFDAERSRLFVAVPGEEAIYILNLQDGRWSRPLQAPRPHVLWYEARPDLLYVGTVAHGGQIKILDLQSRRTLKTIGHVPDLVQILRDTASFRLYATYGEGALAVIHADTGVHTLSVMLPARPGQFAIERTGHRIFVNVPRSNAVAVVDRLSREMTEVWELEGMQDNMTMALDEDRGLLFVGSATQPLVIACKTQGKREIARLTTHGSVQWLFADPTRQRLLAGTNRGRCQLWRYDVHAVFVPLDPLELPTGETSALYDPTHGRLYVALSAGGGRPGSIRAYQWRE
ncbi:MAG: hypothetical protein NZM03_10295 [Limisphaera sp.]|nr:hypothetical protein [Limisphaera sp.]